MFHNKQCRWPEDSRRFQILEQASNKAINQCRTSPAKAPADEHSAPTGPSEQPALVEFISQCTYLLNTWFN